jgi:hypothetical protein
MTEPSATDPDAPDTGPGTCSSCGAQLAPEQDWCLACGTASSARIGELPGLRTAAKVAALTLVLVVFAVGASYAALNHGGKSTQIAALPPAPAPTTTTAPSTDTTPAATPKPTTTTDATPASPPVDSTPTVPPDDSTADFPTDTTDTGSTGDTSSTGTTDTSSSTPRSTTPTKTTTTKTTTTKPKSEKIKLAKNAVSSYDPLLRVQSHTDATAADDGDPSTLFTINTIASNDGVQSGFLVDLGSAQKVTQIHLQTPTPGFTALVYGAVGPDLPNALTDPNWKHLRNATDIGSADGTAKITLGKSGKGVTKYRYLLLWVTSPPSTPAGARDAVTGQDTTTTPVTTDPTSTSTSTVTQPPSTTAATVPTTTPTTTTAPQLGETVSLAELTLFN